MRLPSPRGALLTLLGGVTVTVVAALAAMAHNATRLGADFDRAGEALLRDARAVAALATPGYTERALASLGANPANGQVARLDDLEPVVGVPMPPANEHDTVLWSLEFENADDLLALPAGSSPPRVLDGVLSATALWPASLTHRRPVSIPVEQIGDIQIAVRASTSPQIVLAWSTAEEIPERPVQVIGAVPTAAVDMVPGGGSRTYVVDATALRRRTPPGSRVRRLFVAPVTAEGAKTEIEYVRVRSRVGQLAAQGVGRSYQGVAGDLRHAVHAVGHQELGYGLALPQAPARLRLGLAALGPGEAVRAGVRVIADEGQVDVLETRVEPESTWRDFDVDLRDYAGRRVRLVLWSEAANDQVALWAHPTVATGPRRRLNVLVYLEDTLRADHLSAFGYHRDTSPATRRFGEDAVVFQTAIAQATKTRPSVASLMTSLPPSATGVVRFWERLDEGYLTVAEIMRQQGFETVAMVQNGNGGAPAGLHQGFNRHLDTDVVGDRPGTLVDPVLIPWLRQNAERNFFLYVHVLDPHGPYEPLPPDDAWAEELGADHPATQRIARYDGEIRHADRHFGRVMRTLDELGLARDTIVVFLSDHGEFLGEEGHWGHHPPGDLAVTHVPLIIRYPARLGTSRRIRVPVQHLDVVPTLLELAGIDAGGLALNGRSLVRIARTGEDPEIEARILVSEEPSAHPVELRGESDVTGSFHWRGWHLQRSRIRPRNPRRGWPLSFRASRLPAGRTDLLLSLDVQARKRHATLMRAWQTIHLQTRRSLTVHRGAAVAIDPTANERLRALGYIQ